jgi:lipid II:glycine glycyltransferase (peptidoglycan interpeptide bridge formation enzyme)
MIREITNKQEWEDFLAGCGEKSFLDSWNWGEFQAGQGCKLWRLGVESNSQLQAVALAVKIKARRGTFLLIQHGPCVKDGASAERFAILGELLGELKKIGKKENAFFIRMNPLWARSGEIQGGLKNFGFVLAPMHANAYEATWKLDISSPEDDLMKEMRKTTRYLVRQAQKNSDISIEASENLADAKIYEKLNNEVALRQKFTPFSSSFIEKEFSFFSNGKQALWFFGKYKGEIAAGALVIFWQGTGYYHQAASISKYAKLSIPYLLQWEAIKEAKKRGCVSYDFWGYTDPKKYPDHPWAGPTLFKMGFGGKASEYVLTQDYPLSPFYWPIHYFEKIRKARRKL